MTRANFLVVGVGGQGTLLAADLIALTGVAAGLDVKKSEVHGMAQRGGSVISQVRWAEEVYSPLIPQGEVDYLLAFERLEAVRYAHWLRPGGMALVNDYRIPPLVVSAGSMPYPGEAVQEAAFASARRILVPAMALAQQVGSVRVNNVVMIGALAALLPVEASVWEEVIAHRVPERTVAVNVEAFRKGWAYIRKESAPWNKG
ncbi:MAG: indolepyruvate oxidoreductase subunit beta [Chloroflexi bacterium]|nr:indolepyruvate oxidoreductase subunit beta [Chloroflexota bacterium]